MSIYMGCQVHPSRKKNALTFRAELSLNNHKKFLLHLSLNSNSQTLSDILTELKVYFYQACKDDLNKHQYQEIFQICFSMLTHFFGDFFKERFAFYRSV